MQTDAVQRWRDQRGSYRPAREVIDTRLYEVAPIPDNRTAKRFVLQHHYAGSFSSARFRFGLYWGGFLVGVAVFGNPMNYATFDPFDVCDCARARAAKRRGESASHDVGACRGAGGCERDVCTELTRLVLLDRVPGNGESWFISRCFELIRRAGIVGVVSFSDPVQRTDARGRIILPGHVGTVYQATNAVYTGRSKEEKKLLLPDGTVLHNRALAKIRARDSRLESAAKVLVRHGATPLRDDEDARAWVDLWAERLCRPLAHTGNHRYLFGLTPAIKRRLPVSQPYPKLNVRELLSAAARCRWLGER